MKPPLLPQDEFEEISYVRTLVREEIFIMESYFSRKYPDGCPFRPDREDFGCLDAIEIEMRKRISEGRIRYPDWDEKDVESLAGLVRMHLMMRFKRVEREITGLPDHAMLVEAILRAETESSGLAANDAVPPAPVPMRPTLRIVRDEAVEAEIE